VPPKKKAVIEKETKPPKEKYVQAKQEVLQFEPVTRGRFEKSEPTIVEGQDLDIPTFLRKNIRVK
jgi:cell division protein FtsZ